MGLPLFSPDSAMVTDTEMASREILSLDLSLSESSWTKGRGNLGAWIEGQGIRTSKA